MFTNCPNIWTRKKANMHHADVFKAQCWVPAEIRHLGEGRVFTLNGESVLQVNIGSKSRMRYALHLANLPCSKQSQYAR